jgi:L-fuconolactonase
LVLLVYRNLLNGDMRIDSHQHYWFYHPVKDAWITDEMEVIKRDFSPDDVWPLMQQNNIDGCVAVQADQSKDETHYLLSLAEQYPFIKGVVGWVDFRSPDIADRLEYFSQFSLLKGFRHIVQAEKEDDFLLGTDFCNGIKLLSRYNYTYDVLIYPRHLKFALQFVDRFPGQKFVIDHFAKPFIKRKELQPWLTDLSKFATYPNVYCKMAGLVTEADWVHWKKEDFTPYFEAVLNVFSADRIIFGTDWPVCLPGQSYKEVCGLTQFLIKKLSAEDQMKILGENCSNFYNL